MPAKGQFAATWRKSSYSTDQANCVEVAGWHTSSYSTNQANCVEVAGWHTSSHSSDKANCVEVGFGAAVVGVRDSKNATGPALTVPGTTWTVFLRTLS